VGGERAMACWCMAKKRQKQSFVVELHKTCPLSE
jgi:hypothetical protein